MRLHLFVAPDEGGTLSPGFELPVDDSPSGLVWQYVSSRVMIEDVDAGDALSTADAAVLLENRRAILVRGAADDGVAPAGRAGIRQPASQNAYRGRGSSTSCSTWRSRSRSPWTTSCTTRARESAQQQLARRARPVAAAARGEQRRGLASGPGRRVRGRQRVLADASSSTTAAAWCCTSRRRAGSAATCCMLPNSEQLHRGRAADPDA